MGFKFFLDFKYIVCFDIFVELTGTVPMEKQDKLLSAWLFIFAFLAASAYVFFAPSFPPSPEFFNIDAVDYDTLAYNLYLGNGYCYFKGEPTAFRPPVYPLFLAGIYKLFGYNHVHVKYTQALIHALTVLLLFLTGKQIVDRRVSFIASLYISIYQPFLYANNMILSEPLFVFLVTMTVYLTVLITRGNHYTPSMLVGITSALAFLCRTAIVPYVFLFLPIFLLFQRYRELPGNRGEKLRSLFQIKYGTPLYTILIILTFFILTISPWVVRNYLVFGEFLITDTHGGWVFWQKYIPFYNYGNFLEKAYKKADEKGFKNVKSTEIFRWVFKDNLFGKYATYDLLKREYPKELIPTDEFDINRFYYQKGIEFIRDNPGKALWNILKNGIKFFSPLSTTEGMKDKFCYWFSFLMTFGIIGMIYSTPIFNRVFLLHCVILNFLLMIMLTYAHGRFRYPADPYLALFAAYGVINIYKKASSKYKAIIFYILIILANIFMGLMTLPLKKILKGLI